MTWDEYYEKINDWAVSTAVNKTSSLENIGEPDEVVDALNIIAFEDEKGATRLLNRAIQQGIIFSGENLAEISSICIRINTLISFTYFFFLSCNTAGFFLCDFHSMTTFPYVIDTIIDFS